MLTNSNICLLTWLDLVYFVTGGCLLTAHSVAYFVLYTPPFSAPHRDHLQLSSSSTGLQQARPPTVDPIGLPWGGQLSAFLALCCPAHLLACRVSSESWRLWALALKPTLPCPFLVHRPRHFSYPSTAPGGQPGASAATSSSLNGAWPDPIRTTHRQHDFVCHFPAHRTPPAGP